MSIVFFKKNSFKEINNNNEANSIILDDSSIDLEQDSCIYNLEKVINKNHPTDEITDISILEKNNQKYVNLNPVIK